MTAANSSSPLLKLKVAQEERRARLGIDEQGIEILRPMLDHNGDPVYPENTAYELAMEEGLDVELAEAGIDCDTSPFMRKEQS